MPCVHDHGSDLSGFGLQADMFAWTSPLNVWFMLVRTLRRWYFRASYLAMYVRLTRLHIFPHQLTTNEETPGTHRDGSRGSLCVSVWTVEDLNL